LTDRTENTYKSLGCFEKRKKGGRGRGLGERGGAGRGEVRRGWGKFRRKLNGRAH
jgi:hypothetical protein